MDDNDFNDDINVDEIALRPIDHTIDRQPLVMRANDYPLPDTVIDTGPFHDGGEGHMGREGHGHGAGNPDNAEDEEAGIFTDDNPVNGENFPFGEDGVPIWRICNLDRTCCFSGRCLCFSTIIIFGFIFIMIIWSLAVTVHDTKGVK